VTSYAIVVQNSKVLGNQHCWITCAQY